MNKLLISTKSVLLIIYSNIVIYHIFSILFLIIKKNGVLNICKASVGRYLNFKRQFGHILINLITL